MITDWDDLRFCLAVARSGTLQAAADELGVHHATVSRRIRAFEERLDIRVFDRTPDGYVATDTGRDVLAHAADVEQRFHALERQVRGREQGLRGRLTVSTIHEVALGLGSHLARFCSIYPDVELCVTTSNTYVDLDRREADVAIRLAENPPEHLTGRRIGEVGIAPYASVDYLDRHSDRELRQHDWVGWVDALAEVPMERWLRDEVDSERVKCRFDDIATLRNAVLAGLGVGHLLCWVGDADERLRRVGPLLTNHDFHLWALAHPDLRETARVSAFISHVADALAASRDLLEGRTELGEPVGNRRSKVE